MIFDIICILTCWRNKLNTAINSRHFRGLIKTRSLTPKHSAATVRMAPIQVGNTNYFHFDTSLLVGNNWPMVFQAAGPREHRLCHRQRCALGLHMHPENSRESCCKLQKAIRSPDRNMHTSPLCAPHRCLIRKDHMGIFGLLSKSV